jgi:hypothetical protein
MVGIRAHQTIRQGANIIMTAPGLVFADTETTSLRPNRRVWEIGAITRPAGGTRDDDEEHQIFVDVDDLDLGEADPKSLEIGGFYNRHPQMDGHRGHALMLSGEKDAMRVVERMTRGNLIVGAVPNFDTEALGARMRWTGVCPAWRYHLTDVENVAAGALGQPPPWNFDGILTSFGLTYDEADRHTALGDARMVRDLYDAVFTGPWRNYTMADSAHHVGMTLSCEKNGRCSWEAAYQPAEFPTIATLTAAAIDHDAWHRIHGPTPVATLTLVPPVQD